MSDDVTPAGASLRGRAATGVLWTALQTWSVRATTALAFIVISRQLQPAEFGLVALAMAVIAVLTLLSDTGMATYLIRTREIDERVRSTAFFTSMLFAFVLAGLLLLLAHPVSGLFGEDDLAPVLQVLSITLVITGLTSVPSALLKRRMEFRAIAVRTTSATLVGSVVAITLALLGAGAWALVVQAIVRAVVALALTWAAVRWRPHLVFDRHAAREMLTFGSKLLSIDLLIQVRDRGEEFILAAVAGATTLGFWSVATRLIKIVQETGSSVVNQVATPAFAKLQDDRTRLYRAYETALFSAGAVMFPAMLFLAVTSKDLVPFLLGQQWATTAAVAQVTSLTAALAVFSYFDRSVFVAVGKLRPEIFLVSTIVATHVVVTLLAAPHGLLVLAVALGIRAAVTFPLRQVVLHKTVGVPYRCLLKAFRVLLAAIVMAGACWGVMHLLPDAPQWGRLLAAAGAAAVVYPAALLLTARPVAAELLADLRRLLAGRRARRVVTVPAEETHV
ncbi:lipopolysaccharide biosynthesis protein [Kineococcus gynurae]|uniref:Lipopolysaccharide biosynthesis protein n=1 Tax=Kineococcus gynurae TaxID=452979 RepID=A0ABV5LWP9_9ACTN